MRIQTQGFLRKLFLFNSKIGKYGINNEEQFQCNNRCHMNNIIVSDLPFSEMMIPGDI